MHQMLHAELVRMNQQQIERKMRYAPHHGEPEPKPAPTPVSAAKPHRLRALGHAVFARAHSLNT